MAGVLKQAYTAVSGQQLLPLPEPVIMPSPEVKFTIGDLPLRLLTEAAATTTSFTHLFELVASFATDNPEESPQHVKDKVPVPEALTIPKTNVGSTVSMYMVPAEPGHYLVIKHYKFHKRVSATGFKITSVGEAWVLDGTQLEKHKRMSGHMIHYVLGHLGGFCLVANSLNAPEVEKKLLTEEEIDAGYDYIEQNAPLSVHNNALARWIMKQKNAPESPVFGWLESKIREAANNIIMGKSLAKLVEDYPLTLKQLRNWVLLDIVAPCIKASKEKATYLVGP